MGSGRKTWERGKGLEKVGGKKEKNKNQKALNWVYIWNIIIHWVQSYIGITF